MSFNLVVAGALAYGALLFVIAFVADRRGGRWLRSGWVYTLSLSIYCTAWTFYGAVGYAARSGLEFLTIYLGPSLVMIGWWGLLRRLVAVARRQRVTSIADMVAARYGKSPLLGGLVTVLAVVATTPYIALQLQSVTLSLSTFAAASGEGWAQRQLFSAAFWVALGLAVFVVLFGTRNLNANERHPGVMMAVAVEAVVKLVALIAVGSFVVWGMAGGVDEMLARIDASPMAQDPQSAGRWLGLTAISALALLTLPRMFQVMVVEHENEAHLARAAWAFPAYLLAMSLFVVPIAVMGLEALPAGANPDLFVLTLPLQAGKDGLAMLSFLGGFSSATSMVVVATIALATMMSNHVVLPLWLALTPKRASLAGDIRQIVLGARRASIAAVLGLGYFYYRLSGGGAALAAIGLISFVGIAQIAPAMLVGLFWRGATRAGAVAGVMCGFALWLWALFLPSTGTGRHGVLSAKIMSEGPFGLSWLRPEALFGSTGLDPVLHAMLWATLANLVALVLVSLLTRAAPLERLLAAQFTARADRPGPVLQRDAMASAEDLIIMSQRVIGAGEARALFDAAARDQGRPGKMPAVTPALVEQLEREMAGSVGTATAHAMIGQMSGQAGTNVEDMLALADEAAQILEYSSRLEAKSKEQERTAAALREANARLRTLAEQKDAFLSQISHELRTPMTSVRSLSELLSESDLGPAERVRFAKVIQSEAVRLTRLLDELLDLSVLESRRPLVLEPVLLSAVIARARDVLSRDIGDLRLQIALPPDCRVYADADRLTQVVINLISNAAKYGPSAGGLLKISAHHDGAQVVVDFVDNGPGIPAEQAQLVFEKFARLSDGRKAGGAGLGLAICREIMSRLGGKISLRPSDQGAWFQLELTAAH